MDELALGKAGLHGWRAKVGEAVAEPVAKRTRFSHDQVRAVVGGVFLLLSVLYVTRSIRRMVARR